MKLSEAFGQVLREHREQAGFSQHALAYEAQIDKNNVSLYETGDRLPSLPTVFALSRALGVKPETLIREVGALHPDF